MNLKEFVGTYGDVYLDFFHCTDAMIEFKTGNDYFIISTYKARRLTFGRKESIESFERLNDYDYELHAACIDGCKYKS